MIITTFADFYNTFDFYPDSIHYVILPEDKEGVLKTPYEMIEFKDMYGDYRIDKLAVSKVGTRVSLSVVLSK